MPVNDLDSQLEALREKHGRIRMLLEESTTLVIFPPYLVFLGYVLMLFVIFRHKVKVRLPVLMPWFLDRKMSRLLVQPRNTPVTILTLI